MIELCVYNYMSPDSITIISIIYVCVQYHLCMTCMTSITYVHVYT